MHSPLAGQIMDEHLEKTNQILIPACLLLALVYTSRKYVTVNNDSRPSSRCYSVEGSLDSEVVELPIIVRSSASTPRISSSTASARTPPNTGGATILSSSISVVTRE